MVIAVWPLVILVVGVLVWVLAGNAVLKEIGRWMFIIGLFWLVSTLATKTVKIGSRGGEHGSAVAARSCDRVELQLAA